MSAQRAGGGERQGGSGSLHLRGDGANELIVEADASVGDGAKNHGVVVHGGSVARAILVANGVAALAVPTLSGRRACVRETTKGAREKEPSTWGPPPPLQVSTEPSQGALWALESFLGSQGLSRC